MGQGPLTESSWQWRVFRGRGGLKAMLLGHQPPGQTRPGSLARTLEVPPASVRSMYGVMAKKKNRCLFVSSHARRRCHREREADTSKREIVGKNR